MIPVLFLAGIGYKSSSAFLFSELAYFGLCTHQDTNPLCIFQLHPFPCPSLLLCKEKLLLSPISGNEVAMAKTQVQQEDEKERRFK
jgi:hypothetical protein